MPIILQITLICIYFNSLDMDEVTTWRMLRNDLDGMLKAREMNYRKAVEMYYKENPKDLSEKRLKKVRDITSDLKKKKFADKDNFCFENSPEKKYWKKKPKPGSDPNNDKLAKNDKSRYGKAIEFFLKLKSFIYKMDCPESEQWVAEHEGLDFLNRFRNDVILPLKKEIEEQKYKLPKDKDGMDEFDF